jgi:hypothetical protein
MAVYELRMAGWIVKEGYSYELRLRKLLRIG